MAVAVAAEVVAEVEEAEAEVVAAVAAAAEVAAEVVAEAEAEVAVAEAAVVAVAPPFRGSERPDQAPTGRCCTSSRAVTRLGTEAAGGPHLGSARQRPGWR